MACLLVKCGFHFDLGGGRDVYSLRAVVSSVMIFWAGQKHRLICCYHVYYSSLSSIGYNTIWTKLYIFLYVYKLCFESGYVMWVALFACTCFYSCWESHSEWYIDCAYFDDIWYSSEFEGLKYDRLWCYPGIDWLIPSHAILNCHNPLPTLIRNSHDP